MSAEIQNIAKEPTVEEQIICSLKNKEKQAIQLIFDNYSPVLFNIAMRVVKYESVAQDVLQEALIKIWKNGDTYNSDKGSLFTWMTRICRNAAIDKTRSKDYRLTETSMKAVDIVSISETPLAEEKIDQSQLRDLITRLPENQKVLIDLTYFQGYTHQEISDNLNMPLGTVKTRIRTAIKNLRSII